MKTISHMRRHLSYILPLLIMAAIALPARGADRFITLNLHLLAGGSYVTNDYSSCFPEISDINTTMGAAFGVGAEATCKLGRRFALGTGLNFMRNSRRLDMAVSGAGKPSVSNVFQRNTYYAIDIPVFLRYYVKVATGVMWNIDAGLYYAYGTGGKQKNTIYDAKTNDLGQLITSRSRLETGYYSDSRAFINSYRRGDIGIHIATGLTFSSRLTVGVRTHLGCKNVARSSGIINPSAHNIDLLATLGWNF